jgi:hypothetical protein
MRSLDSFSRAHSDLTVRTALGGYLALCSFAIMLAIFIQECLYFMEVDRQDRVVLESTFFRAKDLNITMQIEMHKLPCGVLAVNVVDKDNKGNHAHSTDSIYKRRSGKRGSQRTGMEYLRGEHATGCKPCYDITACCHTCEDVKASWKERGLPLPTDYVFEQCVPELYTKNPPVADESCLIDAQLNLRQVNARIEIGLLPPDQMYKPPAWDETDLDFSHTVQALWFGPKFPGLVSMLEGRQKKEHKAYTKDYYQYDMHLIPTTYTSVSGETLDTHQYSSTELNKVVQTDDVTPGIFFIYDITPFTAEVKETRKPFVLFVTQCCALIGGIFAFSRMVDGIGYSLARATAKVLVKRSTVADTIEYSK